MPGYTTLCRRQKTPAVQIPCRRADGPLNLLVDSTGIKVLGDGAFSWFDCKPLPGNKWQARKTGVQGRRQSLPSHGVQANRCRATDGARDTAAATPPSTARQCMSTCTRGSDRQATAIIPIRKNGRHWKEDRTAAIVRNETLRATRHATLRATRHDGRAVRKRWTGIMSEAGSRRTLSWFASKPLPGTGCAASRRSGNASLLDTWTAKPPKSGFASHA